MEGKNQTLVDKVYNEIYYYQNVARTRWEFVINAFKLRPDNLIPDNPFNDFFKANGINPKEFATVFVKWLTGKNGKRNVLKLQGPYNTGKSMLSKCITKPFHTAYVGKHALVKCSDFLYQSFHKKSLIALEEPIIKPGIANDMLSFFAGDPLDVNVKYKAPVTISRTPVIVTSNHSTFGQSFLSQTDEQALLQRCVVYHINTPFTPKIQMTSKMFYSFVIENAEINA